MLEDGTAELLSLRRPSIVQGDNGEKFITALFRLACSSDQRLVAHGIRGTLGVRSRNKRGIGAQHRGGRGGAAGERQQEQHADGSGHTTDRKSTRLNSSHGYT